MCGVRSGTEQNNLTYVPSTQQTKIPLQDVAQEAFRLKCDVTEEPGQN